MNSNKYDVLFYDKHVSTYYSPCINRMSLELTFSRTVYLVPMRTEHPTVISGVSTTSGIREFGMEAHEVLD